MTAMEDGKQGVLANPSQNPVQSLQLKFKEMETGFKTWLSQQSTPVEVGIVTATNAIQGGAMGGIMSNFTANMTPTPPPPSAGAAPPQGIAAFNQAQALVGGPWVQARNFAVMAGANAGIACLMKRLRGKEDVQSSMVAAFGSGVLFTLVSGTGGIGNPNPAVNALSSGVFFAAMQGGIYQIGQKFSEYQSQSQPQLQSQSQPTVEDEYYARTRSMLDKLGFQNYEKNFRKGLLNDSTLPLLTDSALKDVSIPPGPRLLILDHIQRDSTLRKETGA
ncbi:Chloroplastic import inner membrane translocase subunit HP30-2 [Linum grandiflorum]